MTKQIPWTTGDGAITLDYNGQGNGTIEVASDDNNLFATRSQVLEVSGGGITRQVTIRQNAAPYRLVEWVENTNGNVLNFSDIVPNDANWEFYGKVLPIFAGAYETVFRAYTGEQNNCYRIIRANTSNTNVYVNGGSKASGGTITASNVVDGSTPMEFHVKYGTAVINGTTFTLSTTQGSTLTTALQINRGRWYGFTTYHNGVMVRSYHPCVDANGKYGLVDVLTGTIKYPTSGSFNSGGSQIGVNFRDADRKWILTKDGKLFNVAEEL